MRDVATKLSGDNTQLGERSIADHYKELPPPSKPTTVAACPGRSPTAHSRERTRLLTLSATLLGNLCLGFPIMLICALLVRPCVSFSIPR